MPAYVASESLHLGRAAVVLGVMLGLAGCSSGSNRSSYTGTGSSGTGSSGGGGGSNSAGSGSGGAGSSAVDAGIPSSGGGPGDPEGHGTQSQAGADGGAGSANGSGEGGAEGNATGEAGPTDGSPDMHADLGKGDGSDVILMGDSWMSNTLQIEGTGGGIAPALIQAAGQPYRNYAVQGVMMLQADTFGPAIPTQYEAAKQANPNIKTVVMTGGGNDIIQNPTVQSDCQMGGAMCKQLLAQISQALDTLWTEMAGDGVEDVVYAQYASNVGSTSQSLRGDAGAATPSICLTGRIRCHSVDTTAAVMSQVAADGIHPLQAANQRIATQVYSLMVQDGMRR